MNVNSLPNLDFEAGYITAESDASVNGRIAKSITAGIAIAIGVLF